MLNDSEIRHLAISLLDAPTERDKQTRVGASNISNGCDRCVAAAFAGIERANPLAARTWLGAVLGTATHLVMETRINQHMIDRQLGGTVSELATRLGDAQAEKHIWFANLDGYGKIGGTIDLLLPGNIIDWKGTTRKKLCLLIDFISTERGLEAPYGRAHKDVKLSEREYASEMEKMRYKVTGYYGQQTLYMHGTHLPDYAGEPIERATLVFINRDGTGYFDVPQDARYEDPKAVHDVWTLSFDYDENYANALIQRAQDIHNHLEAGGNVADFDQHELCWLCSFEAANVTPNIEVVPEKLAQISH